MYIHIYIVYIYIYIHNYPLVIQYSGEWPMVTHGETCSQFVPGEEWFPRIGCNVKLVA